MKIKNRKKNIMHVSTIQFQSLTIHDSNVLNGKKCEFIPLFF